MKKLIDNLTKTADFETAWVNMYGDDKLYKTPFAKASILISWEDVTGTPDGTIEIIGTLGEDGTETIIGSVTVDSLDNTADASLIDINYLLSAVKLRYTANSITSILLNAMVSFS